MFSNWPVRITRDQISQWVKSQAQGFLKKARANPKIRLENENPISAKIDGEVFSGESALLELENGECQVVFLISDGDGSWGGQFSGKKERWEEALGVLKTLKKN